MVGYDSDSPSYRIYNRYTGRVSSSRNVTFIEQPAKASYSDEDSSTLDVQEPDDAEENQQPQEDIIDFNIYDGIAQLEGCLLYTSPSPRDLSTSRMPSSA